VELPGRREFVRTRLSSGDAGRASGGGQWRARQAADRAGPDQEWRGGLKGRTRAEPTQAERAGRGDGSVVVRPVGNRCRAPTQRRGDDEDQGKGADGAGPMSR
jgi:hypothetical protein